jgi:hypothetical protein
MKIIFWDVLTASITRKIIALMMEAVRTSETSVNFYHTTRINIREDIFTLDAVIT